MSEQAITAEWLEANRAECLDDDHDHQIFAFHNEHGLCLFVWPGEGTVNFGDTDSRTPVTRADLAALLVALKVWPAAPGERERRLEEKVAHLIAVNAVHRDGTKIGEASWDTIMAHLESEVIELCDGIRNADHENVLEELGDILGIVVHAALKAGFTMAEVEARELSKLDERFTIAAAALAARGTR